MGDPAIGERGIQGRGGRRCPPGGSGGGPPALGARGLRGRGGGHYPGVCEEGGLENFKTMLHFMCATCTDQHIWPERCDFAFLF